MDSFARSQPFVFSSLFFLVILVVLHFFYGYCQYRLGQKIKIPRSWLAFIPFVNIYHLVLLGAWDKKSTVLFFIPVINLGVILFFMYCFGKRFGKNPLLFMIFWPFLFPILAFQYDASLTPLRDGKIDILESFFNSPDSQLSDPISPHKYKKQETEEDLSPPAPTGPSVGKYNVPKPVLGMNSKIVLPEKPKPEVPKKNEEPAPENTENKFLPPKTGSFSIPQRMKPEEREE